MTKRSLSLLLVGGLLLGASIALVLTLFGMNRAATQAAPAPNQPVSYNDEGLHRIDWSAWKAINPDVVAWISIPGTNIDGPVVQANDDAPQYYLTHDVYRNWNLYGAFYIDAGCADSVDSLNMVIFGHHMNDGSMFSQLADYSSADFAKEHRKIVIQTPVWSHTYSCEGAAIVKGTEQSKQTEFASMEDFYTYHVARVCACKIQIAEDTELPEQMLSLVTCSYHSSNNERTVVYAK